MRVIWYFDFVSPFAYLQWPKVKALAAEREVTLRPFLLGALFKQMGFRAPFEYARKRTAVYRLSVWRARQQGRELIYPPTHPFNSNPALRLCVAAGTTVAAVDAIFDWIWTKGRAADTAEAIAPLAERLGFDDVARVLADAAVKAELRANFDQAIADEVFAVPMLAVGDELFWGDDAHAFALAYLDHPELMQEPQMRRLMDLPLGI